MRPYIYTFILIIVLFINCKTNKLPSNAIIKSLNSEITLELPSNLGQGYQWKLIDTTYFNIIQHSSKTNSDQTTTDIEIFKLKPKKKGIYKLTFYRLRPFDPILDTLTATKNHKTIIIK